MNKNYLLIFALMALLQMNLYGQTNYTEGYIVKINGDTVRGYIDARSDAKNARSIDFKTSLPDKATTYEPTDLATYYLSTGKYYKAKEVTLVNEIGNNFLKKVFLEILEQGKVTLYYFANNVDDNHYYIEKDTSFYELTGEKKLVTDENGVSRLFYNKKYLNIMNFLFKDCPAWNTNSDYEFTEYGLRKAASKYNKCGQNNEKEKKTDGIKENIKVGIAAFAGVNISTVNVDPYYSYFSIMENPDTRILPSLGLAISFIAPRISKNMSLQAGVNYNHKGAFSQTTPNKFDFQYLDMELLLKYTYPKGSVRPFIAAGGNVGYLLNKRESAIVIQQDISNYVDHLYEKMQDYEVGYCLETGVFVPFKEQQKGLIFAFRYEQTTIPIAISNIGTYGNRIFQFKVGYKFK